MMRHEMRVVWRGALCAYLGFVLWHARQVTGQGLMTLDSPRLGAASSYNTDVKQAWKMAQTMLKNPGPTIKKAAGCRQPGSRCALRSSGDSSESFLEYGAFMLALAPSSWTATKKDLTYGVKVVAPSIDQRPCSTCTAAAVVSAAETAVAMALRIDVSQVDLSAMDLYYCSQSRKRRCDSGAALEEILNDLMSRQLIKESCLPYKASPGLSDQVCKTNSCNDMDIHASKGQFEAVPLSNPFDVMNHIRMYGSVVTPFEITNDFAPFFDDQANSEAVYKFPPSADILERHAVVLVGYHLDYDNFDNSYWIVKNSWGPKWADNGMFKLYFNFADFKSSTPYGIAWKPNPDDLPEYEPLPGLTPTRSKPGCCTYKANKYDLLSRIAIQVEVDAFQLLSDNPTLGLASGNLAGKTLLICESPICKQSIQETGGDVASATATKGIPDYAVSLRRSIKDNELDCGYIDEYNRRVPYCKICGGVRAVAARCDADPKCVAFDMENPVQLENGTVTECGYLKKAGRPLEYMENFVNYCKLSKGNNCKGAYSLKRGLSLPKAADIDCNYKNKDGVKQRFCFVSGNVMSVVASCNNNPLCKAFDYFANANGGYLKSFTEPTVPMPSSLMYMKAV